MLMDDGKEYVADQLHSWGKVLMCIGLFKKCSDEAVDFIGLLVNNPVGAVWNAFNGEVFNVLIKTVQNAGRSAVSASPQITRVGTLHRKYFPRKIGNPCNRALSSSAFGRIQRRNTVVVQSTGKRPGLRPRCHIFLAVFFREFPLTAGLKHDIPEERIIVFRKNLPRCRVLETTAYNRWHPAVLYYATIPVQKLPGEAN